MVRLPQEIIRHKRDGGTLDAEHIEHFIEGLTAGHVTEGQAASFLMPSSNVTPWTTSARSVAPLRLRQCFCAETASL